MISLLVARGLVGVVNSERPALATNRRVYRPLGLSSRSGLSVPSLLLGSSSSPKIASLALSSSPLSSSRSLSGSLSSSRPSGASSSLLGTAPSSIPDVLGGGASSVLGGTSGSTRPAPVPRPVAAASISGRPSTLPVADSSLLGALAARPSLGAVAPSTGSAVVLVDVVAGERSAKSL
jgi:hypothetical protein